MVCAAIARERGFRALFSGEPTIGGRYSALSFFGLVPTALLGVDIESARNVFVKKSFTVANLNARHTNDGVVPDSDAVAREAGLQTTTRFLAWRNCATCLQRGWATVALCLA